MNKFGEGSFIASNAPQVQREICEEMAELIHGQSAGWYSFNGTFSIDEHGNLSKVDELCIRRVETQSN